MRIGVVIPAYNAEPFLGHALRSLQAQTYSDWTCVVVDDGSADDTAGLARALDDERITVVRQVNAGVSAARNRGAAELGPAFDALLFFDADDMLLPEALTHLSTALDAAPDASAAYGGVIYTAADGRNTGQGERPTRTVSLVDVAMANPCPTPGGYLIRRSCFAAAGGFPVGVTYGEDWQLITLVSRHGPVVPAAAFVLRYRRHEGSATGTDEANTQGHDDIRRVRSAVYRTPSNRTSDRRVLRQAWRRYNLDRSLEHVKHRSSWKRALGHAALAAAGRPIDLSRRR